jgi:hypothetical protein
LQSTLIAASAAFVTPEPTRRARASAFHRRNRETRFLLWAASLAVAAHLLSALAVAFSSHAGLVDMNRTATTEILSRKHESRCLANGLAAPQDAPLADVLPCLRLEPFVAVGDTEGSLRLSRTTAKGTTVPMRGYIDLPLSADKAALGEISAALHAP